MPALRAGWFRGYLDSENNSRCLAHFTSGRVPVFVACLMGFPECSQMTEEDNTMKALSLKLVPTEIRTRHTTAPRPKRC